MKRTYTVKLADDAETFLQSLDAKHRAQIAKKLKTLKTDPLQTAKKLKGSGYYRVRTGDYRIIFEIEGTKLLVLVVAIGDRKDIYKTLKRLLR